MCVDSWDADQKFPQKLLLCLGLDKHVFVSKNQFLVRNLVKVEHCVRVKKSHMQVDQEGDPVVPKEQVELDSQKFHYDGHESGHHTSLKALKDLCREFEVSTTGSKKQILKRLSRASQERESEQAFAYSQRQSEARVMFNRSYVPEAGSQRIKRRWTFAT